MRNRLAILLGLVVVILGAGYLTLWLTTPKQHVTREAFDRIQNGMTLAEVEAIIGLPQGNYATGPTWVVASPTATTPGVYRVKLGYNPRDARWCQWTDDYGMIRVHFDEQGKADAKEFDHCCPMNPRFLDRLRKLLGL